MILLTDRPKAAQHLLSSLALTNQCAVIGVHQALTSQRTTSIILCDVALDSLAASAVLHGALTAIRTSEATGIVFLARDPSPLTAAQAKALGASVILPPNAAPGAILAAIRSIKNSAETVRPTASPAAASPLTGCIGQSRDALANIFRSAGHNQAVSMAAVERGGDAVISAIRHSDIQGWLDVVWRFDDVTYQHCMLVAGLVAKFTHDLGLSLPHQQLLSRAALLHDIGKAKIPQAILTKPGPLTSDEWAVMRTHAAHGYDLLTRQGGVDPYILDVVRHHHECVDGSGYPDGLKAERISQFVRITTICDVYAALIERRSYKAPISSEKAVAILKTMDGKLDQSLVSAFESIFSVAARRR